MLCSIPLLCNGILGWHWVNAIFDMVIEMEIASFHVTLIDEFMLISNGIIQCWLLMPSFYVDL
jgi:hypothetical protein